MRFKKVIYESIFCLVKRHESKIEPAQSSINLDGITGNGHSYMATTASQEFNGFNHIHRHHHSTEQYYRHDHFHHHFHHPVCDNAFAGSRYNDRVVSPAETPSFPNDKECHSDILNSESSESTKRSDRKDEKPPHNHLPSIGDALLRCDNHTNLHKISPCKDKGEHMDYEDSKDKNKFFKQGRHGEMADLNDVTCSNNNENLKKSLMKDSTEIPEHCSIKTEEEQVLYHFDSQNLASFQPGLSRKSSGDDFNNLIQLEISTSGPNDNFFRSEPRNQNAMDEQQQMDGVSAQNNEPPSYATLTPLQPLPPIAAVTEKYIPNGSSYASFVQQDSDDVSNGYSKIGGMGHSLPPLSNRMLLNGLAAQTRGDIQSQTALDVVNQAAAAAAVTLSPYNKAPVLSSNIIPQSTVANPYDAHVFGRIDQQRPEISSAFQGSHMFSHRPGSMVPQYPASLQDFSNSIQTNAHYDRRNQRIPLHVDTRNESQKIKTQSSERLTGHSLSNCRQSSRSRDLEEVNTREVATKVTQELKRYSIPQAIFAQQVLSRSQGTLSDLLRNPKPWSKLKSGRETFRRMSDWLQQPETQRMTQLRMAACKRKEDEQSLENSSPAPKKSRLVFTDLQKKTLFDIFQQSKRPTKDVQIQISRQLGLEVTTVSNYFMNARRRDTNKWNDDNGNGASRETDTKPPHSTQNHNPVLSHHPLSYSHHQEHAPDANDVRCSYANSVGEALLPSISSSSTEHLQFAHHLQPHNLQSQHLRQANVMLAPAHLSSSMLPPYQTPGQQLDVGHLVSPR
ncbi:uncharacterized protein LOC143465984 isoform X2 [Clavelina lepadiformis]|uniref:uncharacterized protein LOC143465984 isoform X2 n=1 Tax=Clavelina lepadiformis TaxID=159417 RepID=UPI0040435B83